MDTYGEETEEWEEAQIIYGAAKEEMDKKIESAIGLKELRGG